MNFKRVRSENGIPKITTDLMTVCLEPGQLLKSANQQHECGVDAPRYWLCPHLELCRRPETWRCLPTRHAVQRKYRILNRNLLQTCRDLFAK